MKQALKKGGAKRKAATSVRKPVAMKPSSPMCTPKGRKGYDRKTERREVSRQMEGEADE